MHNNLPIAICAIATLTLAACSGSSSSGTITYKTPAPASPQASSSPSASASAGPTPIATTSPTASPKPTPTATPYANACAQTPAPSASANALAVVPFSTFASTLSAGKMICFSAYVFTTASFQALDTAAKNGADETVILPEEELSDDQNDSNQLAADGAHIVYDQGTTTPPLHAKLAIVDGNAYLDGRNWDTTDVVLSDTYAADYAAIENAFALAPTSSTNLDTLKSVALSREANTIMAAVGAGSLAGVTVRFMTESFSSGASNVVSALEAAAQDGATVEVCVLSSYVQGNSGETNLLTTLASPPYNMNVRLNPNSGSEKMTLVSNQTVGWFGSANATSSSDNADDYIDWGLTVSDPTVLNALQSYYDSTFASSTAYQS